MVGLVKYGWVLGVSFCFLVFFLQRVLVCKGMLNVTCLAWLVLVMALMTVCELASFGTLNSGIPRWTDAG